jgi:hypothetical protein
MLAHIAGVPVEEMLFSVASVSSVIVLATRPHLARFHRRRRDDGSRPRV